MNEVFLVSAAVDVGYAVGALLILFWGLRLLDKRAGRPWSETVEIIRGKDNENATATSLYYAARWIGACIVVAAFVGS